MFSWCYLSTNAKVQYNNLGWSWGKKTTEVCDVICCHPSSAEVLRTKPFYNRTARTNIHAIARTLNIKASINSGLPTGKTPLVCYRRVPTV